MSKDEYMVKLIEAIATFRISTLTLSFIVANLTRNACDSKLDPKVSQKLGSKSKLLYILRDKTIKCTWKL